MNILQNNTGCLGSYQALLEEFREQGYKSASFHDYGTHGDVILRHDIDFDPRCAVATAEMERRLGMKATYFFMLSSFSHNLLASDHRRSVEAIRDMGHEVSLHFDPVPYADFVRGFRDEVAIFERAFGVKVGITSIHRPNDFFLNHNDPIAGIRHSYMDCFTKEIAYCSDSQGRFRFGHPRDSTAFQKRETIHLLTHPVWWTIAADDNIAALERYRGFREAEFRANMGENCVPYKKHIQEHADL